VLSEFTGTFPAVLTFSVLLAILCLFSITRIARTAGPPRITPPCDAASPWRSAG
jgi:hypothetical protein